ncbi:MAG: DUF58 domain-containing protein [Gammaproteobacteria bacterium]|nr:DUF58 domain-containing protein [Gammaproteobacteria bacterium]
MAKGANTQLTNLIGLRFGAARLNLFARTRAQSALAGSVESHFRGRGLDFEEVRHYQAGDDTRTIDWRVTARTGVAHTKLFREERERPVFVAIDQRRSMAFGSQHCFKSVQAAEVAALLSWAALRQSDRIGGLVFNDQQHEEVRPKRSKNAILQLLHQIDDFNNRLLSANPIDCSNQINDMAFELRQIARHGSAVFIISDFHGFNEAGVKQLYQLKRHNDVTAIIISDPMEYQLPATGGSVLTDGERRFSINLSSKLLRKEFSEHAVKRHESLKQNLIQYGIPSIEISTQDDAQKVLEQFYGKRKRRPLRVRA